MSIFRHPVLNKDLLLNDFIQDLDVSHELAKTGSIYKGSQNTIAWRLKMLGSKKEKDDWFMIQHGEMRALRSEIEQTLKSFEEVTKIKEELKGKSTDVKSILSSILAGKWYMKYFLERIT